MSVDEIKITFLGGATQIGASSAILEVGDTTLLLDAGIRFTKENPLPNLDELSGKHVDAILITHAHSDHTGSLPIVHEAFPNAPIFMTEPTRDLVAVLQRDALKLMDIKEDEIPLFGEKQVLSMLEKIIPVEKDRTFEFADLKFTYTIASHILGACMIQIETPYGNVVFSGDYSITPQKTVPDFEMPKKKVDLFITESTYGNRLHADRKTAEAKLLGVLKEVVENGGKALIPAFAIGRAQEVLVILKRAMDGDHFPKVPVYVDGMVRSVCNVYSNHPKYLKKPIAKLSMKGSGFYDKNIKPVENKDREQIISSNEPCIIVSSSGMLSGGPSALYAEKFAGNEKNTIIITGYQDEESPGRALLNLANQASDEKREIWINGKAIPVLCRFESYSLSAHADRIQMSGLIRSLQPKTVLLVHGDEAAKEDLKKILDCSDVESCTDGQIIRRKYKEKREAAPRVKPMVNSESLTECLKDLTPPYNILDITKFYVGEHFSKEDRASIEINVKAYGFLFEDPNSMGMYWEKKDLPTKKSGIKERSVETSYKGILFELSQKMGISSPDVVTTEKDGKFVSIITITGKNEVMESAPCLGDSKKEAEQRAAQDIIDKYDLNDKYDFKRLTPKVKSNKPYDFEVSVTDRAMLKEKNPKGAVLELYQKSLITLPELDLKQFNKSFIAKVKTTQNGVEISSATYMYSSKDGAAASAYNDLFEKIPNKEFVKSQGIDLDFDARVWLAQKRQLEAIRDFEYKVISSSGPPHDPVFEMQALAYLNDGKEIKGETITAKNKKLGQILSAKSLYENMEGQISH